MTYYTKYTNSIFRWMQSCFADNSFEKWILYLVPDFTDHLPSNFLKSPSTMEKWSSRSHAWRIENNKCSSTNLTNNRLFSCGLFSIDWLIYQLKLAHPLLIETKLFFIYDQLIIYKFHRANCTRKHGLEYQRLRVC